MKTIVTTIAFCLLFTINAVGRNDGVFYARGGNLIPMQETQIRLNKEVLKFYVREFEYMDVEVNFDFYNPGKAKTVTVGFVTPPASGDVEEDKNHPRISRFTVTVNGESISYKVKKMSETSFKADGRETYGTDYVYYFPVTFNEGLNKIRHTYRFQGGASVETQRDFDYQITTGKRWANKQIDDFELEVHLDRGIFWVPLSFQKDGTAANWKIIGRGTFSKPRPKYFGDDAPSVKFVQLQNGYLSFKQKNFKPDFDISISERNWNMGWYKSMCKDEKRCPVVKEIGMNLFEFFRVVPSEYHSEEMLAEHSAKDLRIVRNFLFAIRGYEFKSPDLSNYFSQFFWYKPDPDLRLEDIVLSQKEEDFIRKVRKVERSKAGP